ncbi:hypothetical protein TTHERM_001135019 (macronuclear) [Tetrahymena thermophila SB210]|uniref:Kinase domain protein n=1 Tax=Tetrahymena thermophila (strain SB210) TaxID=312017 RepID=W7XEX1_TETTS|nr:hypothetical protein TTHERM_001135019 [Tetrahymena thermophila SB210]EWS75303.1 hypothetical protein TTHERM_001135019 [Tetrahymena thermophila SB210]|eukprot:XP_012652158.1 hypothetical protein TTHERM_001135019 [Tetrahymena thermophila SB210]
MMMKNKKYFESEEDIIDSNLDLITDIEMFIENDDISIYTNALAKCKNLTTLRLDFDYDTYINEQTAEDLASALGKCVKIQSLALATNGIEIFEQTASPLASAIANCSNLQNLSLELDDSKINGESLSYFSSALQKCINIQTLNISLRKNNLNDESALTIFCALSSCTNLKSLNLDFDSNFIGEKCLSGLGSSLAKCLNLSKFTFRISENQIGDEISSLGQALQNCSNLQSLELFFNGDNDISEKNINGLGSALSKLNRLSTVLIYLEYEDLFYIFKFQNN